MRLSSLVVAAFLIVPLTLFAQHGSGGGGSSGGGGGHSGGGGSSGGSHASSGGSSSHGSSHGSASHSGGGHASAGSSHSAGGATNRGAASNSPSRHDLISFLRHPFSHPKPQPGEPDLRHRVCLSGHCEQRAPNPVKAEFREVILPLPVCLKGRCTPCPPGQTRGKNGGCFAPNIFFGQCQPGAFGSSCLASPRCQPGEIWNGLSCTVNMAECASFISRAHMLGAQIRNAENQMQASCSGNSLALECDSLSQQYDGAITQYRMLQTEVPVACQARLPDPLSF